MKHGSLFSGVGGFDLAAELMGWENVFHCEINPFGRQVLKYYWPDAESFEDITKTDFTKYANSIDILTGGFPCQPYSTAGKRKGKEDERHLWPEMLRAIREIQPRWVVGENVFGLVNWAGGLVFHEVQTDLEAAGYEVWPYVLPACAKDAPHRRDRVWFVAHHTGERRKEWEQIRGWENTKETKTGVEFRGERFSGNGFTPDTGNQRLQIGIRSGRRKDKDQAGTPQGREFTRTHTTGDWAQFPTQSPICSGNDGLSTRLDFEAVFSKTRTNKHKPKSAFPKWRNESIKAAGNAVVPQVVYEIFKAIQTYEAI